MCDVANSSSSFAKNVPSRKSSKSNPFSHAPGMFGKNWRAKTESDTNGITWYYPLVNIQKTMERSTIL